MMQRIFMTLALTVVVPSFALGQGSGHQGKEAKRRHQARNDRRAEEEILKLESALKEAGGRGDASAIERLMAEEAIATFPDGRVDGQTKHSTLAAYRSGEDFGGQVENKDDEVKVLVFGSTAVVSGCQRSK